LASVENGNMRYVSIESPTRLKRGRRRPLLLFFTRRTSGPARRMESLIAHYARTERARLRVVKVDADEHVALAEKLSIDQVPTLVLVKEQRPVERLDGRATGAQIERMIRAHVA
jgi:thioredoxin-like negative regulator of GroEL